MAKKHLYRVSFLSQGKAYEVYAREISTNTLFGFLEIESLVFGERSGLVLDPGEEKIKAEFAGVERCFVPLHAVQRIDEVSKRGTSKITAVDMKDGAAGAVPIYTPTDGGSKS